MTRRIVLSIAIEGDIPDEAFARAQEQETKDLMNGMAAMMPAAFGLQPGDTSVRVKVDFKVSG